MRTERRSTLRRSSEAAAEAAAEAERSAPVKMLGNGVLLGCGIVIALVAILLIGLVIVAAGTTP